MRTLTALLVLPVLLLTACSGGDDGNGGGGGEGSAAASDGAGGGLSGVTVSGPAGKPPEVEVQNGFSVEETTTEVLSQGDGEKVAPGATVLVDYLAVNAKNGNTFADTYQTGQAQTFPLDDAQGLPPGIVDSLVGKNSGGRVVSAIPPSQLFGPQGNPQVQVGGNDTVVFVFDIREASDPEPLEQVEGTGDPQLPAALPQLQVDQDGTPTGFEADGSTGPAPKELQVHTLVEGDGPEVESGDLLTVHYLGQVYPGGKVFDQSYTRGEPTTFQVGVGALISGWDEGLVGVKKGSRVVLAVPPDQGYGAQGNPQAGIKGTDTLLFVIDVLGVS